jgi:DNA-binding NarL/FixJ family response regulator
LLTGDLMTQSRVAAAAERCGASLQMTSDAAGLVAKCADSAVSIVLIDLTFKPLNVAALVAQLKSLPEVKPAIIAFGPHVHESLLAAAEEAGCDEVLSRGQFFGQLDATLERLLGASG